jgi:hypothetical protein
MDYYVGGAKLRRLIDKVTKSHTEPSAKDFMSGAYRSKPK